MSRHCVSFILMLLLFTVGHGVARETPGPPLLSIKEMRETSGQATRVHVKGVVTLVEDDVFFLQDHTAAIPVDTLDASQRVTMGDEVEVTGVLVGVNQGMRLRVPNGSVTKLGVLPLPEPEAVTAEILTNRGFTGPRVRVIASVHDVAMRDGQVRLLMQARSSSFFVKWNPPQGVGALTTAVDWLDALVEITAVAHSGLMMNGDTKAGYLHLSAAEDLRVINKGASDVLNRPLLKLSEMRPVVSPMGERFRMIGVVSYASPAGWFYFQDDTGSARGGNLSSAWVDADQRRSVLPSPLLHPGDEVELVGFRVNGPALTPVMPWLGQCEWRVIRHGAPPPFPPTNAASIMAGDFDGQPVSVTGRVMETQVQKDFAGFFNHTISLDDAGVGFQALVQRTMPSDFSVKPGDYVRLDGVVFSTRTPEGATTAFRVNVNEFENIRATPVPLRSLDITRWLVGVAASATVAMIWIFLLRRQVRRQTAKLREANEQLIRFKAVVDNTSDLVAMTDLEGATVYTNRAGIELLGYDPAGDVAQFNMRDVYPAHVYELFEREGFASAMQHGHWSTQISMKHRDGHEIPVSFVGIVVKGPDGNPEYMACIARNATAQHQLEKQLRESLGQERELNQLKSSFVNTISHEFRTPLGIILFASSMLRRFDARFGPQERAGQLDAIDDAVTRMNDLVEQSLSLGRAETAGPNLESFDVLALSRRLVDEVLSSTSHRSSIQLETDEALPPAFSDQTMLRAILGNLMGNAVKYSPPGSRVLVRLERQGTRGVFTVRDHGPGLEPEDLPKLFTMFHRGSNTAEVPGTGLGLAIVKRCVDALGGAIIGRNADEGGAEFTVELPLFSPEP